MKAIIPCGGLGTRMNPTSEYIPKELLPIWDMPAVHYTIQEAINAGLDRIVLVVSPCKLDLFRKALHRESDRIEFAIQSEPNGLGHAISCALDDEDEEVAVLLPDEFIPYGMSSLIKKGRNILVQQIPEHKKRDYGMVETVSSDGAVLSIREKPIGKCCADFGIIGRYVLNENILKLLRSGDSLEIALDTSCMNKELYCLPYYGVRYDTGCRDGWMRANYYVAMQKGFKLNS